jgi:hypothetical protein
MIPKKKIYAVFVIIMIALGSTYLLFAYLAQDRGFQEISIEDVLSLTSDRNNIEELVITSDEHPMLTMVATPVACWYNIGGGSGNDSEGNGDGSSQGLKPLLVAIDGELNQPQYRFMDKTGIRTAMILGEVDYSSSGDDNPITGSPYQISLEVAKKVFKRAAGAIIIEDNQEGYELGITATPMASYLNIPVIIKDSSTAYNKLKSNLNSINVEYTIIIGKNAESTASKLGFKSILLESREEITKNALVVIQHRFNEINYITMTNPTDIVPPEVVETVQETYSVDVNNLKVKTGSNEMDIVGESKHTQDIFIPEGINRVQIHVNFTDINSKPLDPFKDAVEVEPIIFASLYDTNGRIVAYAPSFSLEVGKTYLETQTFNLSGNYQLETNVYYGTRGFDTYAGTEFGISNIEGRYEISVSISTLSRPHLPLYPQMSVLAPYLSAAHGGIVLADPDFELTKDGFEKEVDGYGTGPYYETEIHEIVNERVLYVVEQLEQTMELFKERDLYDDYINGPAWLAIMAGSNMIPNYYEPKDSSWVEDPVYGTGWATDLKYSLELKLSLARVIGRDLCDVSALIARTLFYEPYVEGHTASIKQEYGNSEEWGNNFHFLAGELGGRTGWFFWQREFASEVEDHGFQSEEYYQNYENDRQTMIQAGAYERANYFDLMMHGNWYWYVPELNGIDSYSAGVKVSDIMKAPDDWDLGPSTYVTGSCIMGRIDGIPPHQSLTFAFMHAGVNAFFSASRSTGSEAKAGTIERSLLYDDISVGEALRLDKTVNQEPAAYYVRNLFGDPAFNPYEPENGFSDQGRPELKTVNDDTGNIVKVPRSLSSDSSSKIFKLSDEDNNKSHNFESYHTYETMMDELFLIEDHHSDIVALYSLTTTYEGREIWAVKVSDNPKEYEEGEPEVLFTGAHHGREWPSYEVPLYFLTYLVENYGKLNLDNDGDGKVNEDVFDGVDNDEDGEIDEDEDEARITWLIDNRQIWIIPMVNPDGVSYAHMQFEQGGTAEDYLWRKNREPNINPVTGDPYPEELGGNDMWGTDLNRNYGFHWGELGYQGYADPSREDYIGPLDKTDNDNDRRVNEDKMDNLDNDGDGNIDEDPRGGFSATETKAIKKLVEEHNFVITLNFHTYGNKIYWPWMWTLELPPDEELYCHLAKGMSRFNNYEYRNMSERAQNQLSRHPPVDGDSNDWMYGKHGILAYTIEIGTQFIPPEDEIEDICKLHLGANLLVVEVADDPWQYKFTIEHEPIKDTTSTYGYKVNANIDSPFGLEIKDKGVKLYYSTDGKNYKAIVMEPNDDEYEYSAKIPGQLPGTKISYFISVTDKDDRDTQLPKYAPYNIYSFTVVTTRGNADISLLALHVFFIVGAIFFVIAAAFYSVRYIIKGVGFNRSIQTAGIATGMIFVGGFPLGFIIAYQVFGTPWTGIPFGWDITDNKTLVILLYFTLSLFMVRGTIMNIFSTGRGRFCPFKSLIKITRGSKGYQQKKRQDSISHQRFARLMIIGALITITLYLVPHSLMVSPIFTILLFGLLIGIFLVPSKGPVKI